MTDMMQRMGDIRMGASDGIWARTYGGKAKYDKDHAYTSNSFWGAQVGADHALASGWHIGAAFDYNDGDASYRYGGSGDPKQYLGSLYGMKTFEDGQYLDIVGKFGHTQNDYSVYNADGKKLDGKYSANGYGLSLEYGKRFGSSMAMWNRRSRCLIPSWEAMITQEAAILRATKKCSFIRMAWIAS